VLPVWRKGIYGKGSVIAFIDDGIQYTHPDLAPNWLKEGSWNFNMRSSDVLPLKKEHWHGTAVAGLALAYPDGVVCGVGVAPNAHFTAIVLLHRREYAHRRQCSTGIIT
jgi:subtilisin family serine protease